MSGSLVYGKRLAGCMMAWSGGIRDGVREDENEEPARGCRKAQAAVRVGVSDWVSEPR
jgi:hypothetical protein